jgi:hypothetical protein
MIHWIQLVSGRTLSNDVDRSENVDREELLTFIAASVQLTLISDTRFAQTNMRSEAYEINSDRITRDRAKAVRLLITSQSDSRVDTVGITESLRVRPVPAPAAPVLTNSAGFRGYLSF